MKTRRTTPLLLFNCHEFISPSWNLDPDSPTGLLHFLFLPRILALHLQLSLSTNTTEPALPRETFMFKVLTVLSLIWSISGAARANPSEVCPIGSVMTLQGCIDAIIIGQSVEFHHTGACPANLLTEVNTGRCYQAEDPFVRARTYYLHKMVSEFQKAKPESEAMAAYQQKKLTDYQEELRALR